MTIVPVKNEYEREIVELVLNIQRNEFNVPVTLEDQPDLLDIDNFYYKNGGCFLAAFINGKLVGTIALIKFSEDAGAIRKMFVQEEYRGKEWGIGQALLDELIAYSKNNGISNLYLGTVPVLQAALRFYEKNGFMRLQKEELPEAFPRMALDSIFCQLTLTVTK